MSLREVEASCRVLQKAAGCVSGRVDGHLQYAVHTRIEVVSEHGLRYLTFSSLVAARDC